MSRSKKSSTLNEAYLNQKNVEVWSEQSLETIGEIEKHLRDYVKINNMYYLKALHQFFVVE